MNNIKEKKCNRSKRFLINIGPKIKLEFQIDKVKVQQQEKRQ